jgi:hypothetical protein
MHRVEVVGVDLRFDAVERARVLLSSLGFRHRRLEQPISPKSRLVMEMLPSALFASFALL